MNPLRVTFAATALFLAACKLPTATVDVGTKEPVKVDISMRLDVYQHGDATVAKKPPTSDGQSSAVAERRRSRMGEVQLLKNSRLIGENHLGLLEVRNEPPGEYGEYVRSTVNAENEDRTEAVKQIAQTQKQTLDHVQRAQGELWRERAFAGEWIEISNPNGSYTWIQKEK